MLPAHVGRVALLPFPERRADEVADGDG